MPEQLEGGPYAGPGAAEAAGAADAAEAARIQAEEELKKKGEVDAAERCLMVDRDMWRYMRDAVKWTI